MAVKKIISPSKRIILVILAYHMYRVKKLFEKKGFIVITYKVDYKISNNKDVTILDFLPSANNLELIEIGIREIIGRLFYLVKN